MKLPWKRNDCIFEMQLKEAYSARMSLGIETPNYPSEILEINLIALSTSFYPCEVLT